MEKEAQKTELERFREWCNGYPSRRAAAIALGYKNEDCIFGLLSGKRPISDSARTKWLRVGGTPDIKRDDN